MNNRFINKLVLYPVADSSLCSLKKKETVCILHSEDFIKLGILRSSRMFISKHRIDLYPEKINENKSDNKLFKLEFRPELQSAITRCNMNVKYLINLKYVIKNV